MITSRAMQRHEKVADRAGSLVTERVRALIETAQARANRVERAAADEAHRLDSQRMQAASRIVSQMGELEGPLERLRQQMQSEHAVDGSYVEEGRLIEAVQEREVDAPAGREASRAPSPAVTDGVEEPPVVDEPPADEVPDASVEEVEELAAEVQGLADEVKELKAEVLERTAEVEELRSEAQEPSVGSEAQAPPSSPDPDPDPDPEPEPEPVQVPPESEEAAPIQAEGPSPETEPAGEEATDDAQRSRFSFRRKRETPEEAGPLAGPDEIDSLPEQATQEAYACGVCGRGFAGNEDELKSLGWVVSESGGVTCADCHSAGWLRPGS